MSRRALTLLLAGFLVLALGVVGAFRPVPYVVLSPGPTENTIGDVDKKPVISIKGRQTYPTTGSLNLVTVAYQGGPAAQIDLLTALRGWLDPTVAVVPQETIFAPNRDPKEVEEENVVEMTNSQDAATAAALNELKIPYTVAVGVLSTEKGKPADGKVRKDDEIIAVDGKAAADVTAVQNAVKAHKPGDSVVLTVTRAGEKLDIPLQTVAGPQKQTIVGLTMQAKFKFPFEVDINVGDVGGPSAGLMFSLGIYDKLTPGELTGGKKIAGTGTIEPTGEVGAIGGIAQKMIGAQDAGATIFLTPPGNCAEAMKAVPDGLRLVKAETLHQAVLALDSLRTGKGQVPACEAG
ncbi:PDZ domain-containing protein [Nonomuraea sp. MG754425]|uniref:YlbL family protein n=1 Tax=Nonomuraea sp. MG754425 TaxID=2570319 RepID=UPI001F26D0FD|nr:PDZ domain-containing protein [Nonomuraea sp. MG754425]MCF6475206.1 PDZ domain-containing protein [Nonomuraea sp. MG754425]